MTSSRDLSTQDKTIKVVRKKRKKKTFNIKVLIKPLTSEKLNNLFYNKKHNLGPDITLQQVLVLRSIQVSPGVSS